MAEELGVVPKKTIADNTKAKAPKTVGQRLDRTVRQTNLGLKKAARFAGKHKAALIASGIGLGAAAAGGAAGGAIGYHRGKKAGQSQD